MRLATEQTPARTDSAEASSRTLALASNRGKRIGILIVAYNAATTLSKVLKQIPEPVWTNVEEIAVFDDASLDDTYALAVGLKTTSHYAKLTVLRNVKNLGYGGNQKAGYRYFIERGFDAVVLLHGDGQYAPELLANLYQPIVAMQADAVFGSRMKPDYGGPVTGGMPVYKYLGNRILTAIENRVLGMNLSEFHSGYRAYSLQALKSIDLSQMTDDFHFDTEIIIKLHHQGFRIMETAIPTYYGTEICYVNGFPYAYKVLRAVRRYRQSVKSIRRHAEFQEYFVRYAVKTSSHSSHAYLREHIGTANDVLDIGCGEGFLALEMKQMGNRVWGMDAVPTPIHIDAFETYVPTDLDSLAADLPEQFTQRQFDRVLLLDVLEHLHNPEALLQLARRSLKPSGLLLVSLPNVANITVRLKLLFGRFEYQDRGILDRTHLRFFTRATAERLLEAAGLKIIHKKMTVMPLELVFGSPDRNPAVRLAHWLLIACTRLMPGLFGYQTFFLCRRQDR